MNETYVKLYFESCLRPWLILSSLYFKACESTVKMFFPEENKTESKGENK